MTGLIERNQVIRTLLDDLGFQTEDDRKHCDRVAVYAVATGERLGLSDERLLILRYAAQLHKVGVLALQRESERADELSQGIGASEMNRMAAKTREILGPIEWLREAIPIICDYYEIGDRSDSPSGIGTRQVSIESHIIAVCSAYDRWTHSPLSQGTLTEEEAIERLRSEAGTYFAADVVEAFASIQSVIQPLSGSS